MKQTWSSTFQQNTLLEHLLWKTHKRKIIEKNGLKYQTHTFLMSSRFVISGDSPPCTHRNCWFISAARGRQSKASIHASYTLSEYLILPVMEEEESNAKSNNTALIRRASPARRGRKSFSKVPENFPNTRFFLKSQRFCVVFFLPRSVWVQQK